MNPAQPVEPITLEEIPDDPLDRYEIIGSFVDRGQRVLVVERRGDSRLYA